MDSARPAGMSRRFSGIDFDDVFGGPPARSVFGGSADSLSSSGREAGDPLRASFGEKPVFGEPYSPASSRRKAPAEDFFSDIFGGGVSGGSTPRKLEWDILSPGRPPPPRTSSDAAASLLSPFSVTNYIERTQDFSASISLPHHVSTNMEDIAPHLVSSSIANEVHGTQADQRTLLQGDLSFRVFHDEYASVETDDTSSIEGHFYEDATNLKDKKRTDHFHFSIYKWASRGVMLMMPSSPKEEKTRGRLSGLPMPYLHGVGLPLNRKNMPSSDRVFPSEVVRPNIASCRELSEATYRALHQTTETTCFQSERMAETVLSVESQVKVPGVGADLGAVSSKDCSNLDLMQEEEISTLRKLLGLIKEHDGGKDGETSVKLEGPVIQTASEKIVDNLVGRKKVKESSIDQADIEKENSGYKTSKESFPGIAEGRVKDFVKIFNQDVSSKPMSFLEPRSWSFRAKDMEACTQDHERLDINKLSSEDKLKSSSTGRDLSHEALMKKNANRDKLAFDANPEVEGIHKYSSEKPIIPSTESTSENIEDLYGDMEGPYFEVEEFMVEEVVFQLQNQDDPVTTSEVNELQTLDAKIREWSAGKEGNIRSLLSTLQQVLWPGSGWKVIPLVDLIESSSVKKAYQRALLHLHPDKLQQRGALEHQKYIAEKVFDILQEAWTQFGSVSSI